MDGALRESTDNARTADRTGPMGEAGRLSTIAMVVGRTSQPANEGWTCGICNDTFAYGTRGTMPTFGCATCGSGICIECAIAAYAMTGTAVPIHFGRIDDEATGMTTMSGGCPYCRADWLRNRFPFFEGDGASVYGPRGWAGDVLDDERLVARAQERTILREIRDGSRSIETDGSTEAWACVWLSGILDTPVKRVFSDLRERGSRLSAIEEPRAERARSQKLSILLRNLVHVHVWTWKRT